MAAVDGRACPPLSILFRPVCAQCAPAQVYVACRITTLIAVVIAFVGFNVSSEVSCEVSALCIFSSLLRLSKYSSVCSDLPTHIGMVAQPPCTHDPFTWSFDIMLIFFVLLRIYMPHQPRMHLYDSLHSRSSHTVHSRSRRSSSSFAGTSVFHLSVILLISRPYPLTWSPYSVAIWGRHKLVLAFTAAVWLTNVAFALYSAYLLPLL